MEEIEELDCIYQCKIQRILQSLKVEGMNYVIYVKKQKYSDNGL